VCSDRVQIFGDQNQNPVGQHTSRETCSASAELCKKTRRCISDHMSKNSKKSISDMQTDIQFKK
jgi:hypothetical protein